jgi:plastocyanin
MRTKLVVALSALAVVVVCGSAQAGVRPGRAGVAHTVVLIKSVNVAASEFKFVLSSKTAKRGIVIFHVKNVGKVSHDFQINGRRTRMISAGKSATLRVVFLRKGSYPYKCTVPGHAAAGMVGVFTIT